LRPDAGRIEAEGAVLLDTEAGAFVPPHRRRVGYVFQDARLFPHLSVRQNLLYGRWFARREPGAAFGRIVDLLGLGALLVLPGTLLFLSVLATQGDYPAIHDITTDLNDPPVFTHAPDLRGPDSNSLAVKPDTLGVQREAYPDLASLRSERTVSNAYRHALEVAAGLGWDIVWQSPESGYIEAVETTAIMAFKDDIAIRIRSTAEGSVIDLRSVSRVGVGYMGANAQRIRAFINAFDQQGN
jgi:ABC-type sugar transport system ATPase subunit